MTEQAPFRAGHVAVVGRPNVGKSTLVNALVGFRVSIVAPKPQTTRHRILGILTHGNAQIALIDTPGLHQADGSKALNRVLNRSARGALADADAIALLVEAGRWTDADQEALKIVAAAGRPVVLVINKIDKFKSKQTLLPYLQACSRRHDFVALVPISAKKKEELDRLESVLVSLLPQQQALYEADQITDRSERFLVGEAIREQLVRMLEEELPYSTTVEVEQFEVEPGLTRIGATIFVERDGQKAIVIGDGGSMIKNIGIAARKSIEHLLGVHVHLVLVARVRRGWSDDDAALRKLGYAE